MLVPFSLSWIGLLNPENLENLVQIPQETIHYYEKYSDIPFFFVTLYLLFYFVLFHFGLVSHHLFHYRYNESVSCSVVLNSLRPHGLQPIRLLHPWNSPGKNTGVGSHSLLQGIFPIQESDPDLLHGRQILYCLSHQGSPSFDEGSSHLHFVVSLINFVAGSYPGIF